MCAKLSGEMCSKHLMEMFLEKWKQILTNFEKNNIEMLSKRFQRANQSKKHS